MGWYHLTQLLEMENANVIGMVETFFLNSTLCPNPPAAFKELVTQLRAVFSVKISKIRRQRYHAPHSKLLKECVDQGAKVIYLEKPGAPTVAELQEMR